MLPWVDGAKRTAIAGGHTPGVGDFIRNNWPVIAIAVVFATGPPFWFEGAWQLLSGERPSPETAVVGFVGGCEPFRVYAQNRYPPLGTRKRRAPDPLATAVGSFAGNEIIAVDGWVRAAVAYPSNSPPWNSDAWYHLADGSGWVAFAAVRALPTVPDPTSGFSEGGPEAPLPDDCEGAVR